MSMATSFSRGRGEGYAPTRGGFGSWRGGNNSGRGRGGKPWSYVNDKRHNTPDIKKHPLGSLLRTFKGLDTTSPVSDAAELLSFKVCDNRLQISDCQYVASYNWLGRTEPTIMIPGKPPRWTPLNDPRKLKLDSGEYYRDPNAARYPEYPLVPVVQTILNDHKGICTSSIDVLACGSTLGSLLRVVRGVKKPFRFCVEVIGDTVFFLRKGNDPKELIEDVRGYGHTFPEAYTTWDEDVKGSETSQRIVQYKFGGLQCIVRFECDGYMDSASKKDTKATPVARASHTNDPLDALHDMSITSKKALANIGGLDNLTVQTGGEIIPQSSIFDLKTRSIKHGREIDMEDIYPLLWIKQVPNFILAYHNGDGLFKDIRVQDVKKDVKAWQEDNELAIGRLAALLNNIVEFAKDKRELLEVYYPGTDTLEIRYQHGEGVHALPSNLADRWAEESVPLDPFDSKGYSLNELEHYSDDADDSDGSDKDYTACSASDCGYCGKCTY